MGFNETILYAMRLGLVLALLPVLRVRGSAYSTVPPPASQTIKLSPTLR